MDASALSSDQLAAYHCAFNYDVIANTSDSYKRGVGWVLRWAAAIAVLWVAGCVLVEFAYCLAAEHTLTRAARAGALEATLPRASFRSVGDSVERRLVQRASWTERLTLSVHRNGAAIGGAIQAAGGDRMGVTLAVPVRAVVPPWLSSISLRTGLSQIEVRAERTVPGRALCGVGSL
jgi:hypothetical protein